MGFHCGTNSAQKIPSDYVDTSFYHFQKSVIALRKAKNIDHSRIINMDQTMCCFDIPPNRTNIKKKEIRLFESRPHKWRRKDLQQWQMEPNSQ